jgi:hypothetical protein
MLEPALSHKSDQIAIALCFFFKPLTLPMRKAFDGSGVKKKFPRRKGGGI